LKYAINYLDKPNNDKGRVNNRARDYKILKRKFRDWFW
jgi:hypothetical protein